MKGPRYGILDGKEVRVVANVIEWAKEFETAESRVFLTKVGGSRVQTIFLGTNHQHGEGPPLWFESMVFPECDIQERYSTWDEAQAGHDKIVASLKGESQ